MKFKFPNNIDLLFNIMWEGAMVSKKFIAINALMAALLGGCAEIPEHAVIAFNATTCPHEGWRTYTAAEGVFVRGLDLGENPKFPRDNPNEKKYADPDGKRDPGSQQDDLVGPHTHGVTVGFPDAGYTGPGTAWHDKVNTESLPNVDPKTGKAAVETRPKNVALLYCEKIK